MKKEQLIGIRIELEVKEAIEALAEADERTLAWMTRKLVLEALEARGVWKPEKEKAKKKFKT